MLKWLDKCISLVCAFSAVEPFKEGQLSEMIVKKLLNQDVIHTVKLRNKENPKADSHAYIYTQVNVLLYCCCLVWWNHSPQASFTKVFNFYRDCNIREGSTNCYFLVFIFNYVLIFCFIVKRFCFWEISFEILYMRLYAWGVFWFNIKIMIICIILYI